jgi:hypothetical protein
VRQHSAPPGLVDEGAYGAGLVQVEVVVAVAHTARVGGVPVAGVPALTGAEDDPGADAVPVQGEDLPADVAVSVAVADRPQVGGGVVDGEPSQAAVVAHGGHGSGRATSGGMCPTAVAGAVAGCLSWGL